MEKDHPLRCPVCLGRLRKNDKSYVCGKNHSFDIARQGYVNLLPVQNKHSRSPGDTKAMLLARREFLYAGFYEPVCRDAAELINKYKKTQYPLIADIGSGEGYYTQQLQRLCDHQTADAERPGEQYERSGLCGLFQCVPAGAV